MAYVLLIDDDAQVGNTVRKLLERAGHDVRLEGDGRAGLRAFRERSPDVVVTDIYMPDCDGFEVIRELRGTAPDTLIVAASGGGAVQKELLLGSAEALGADLILSKPFKIEVLLEAIDQAIAARQPASDPAS